MNKTSNIEETEKLKHLIIELFMSNVKGKKPDTSSANTRHAGREGHWLETQMGIIHNASNTPDIHGFEMKNETSQKTTFGDWSADYYIFKNANYGITRDEFMVLFGKPNDSKGGRYSWSGEPCPKKVDEYNSFGQTITIDENDNIFAMYDFSKDTRQNKNELIPAIMQVNDLVLAKWNASSMKIKVERKFNHRGWFKCLKDEATGVYCNIVFGEPITFENWIMGVKKGLIFFDSGMYQTNVRPYSQWRAMNNYWDSLITSKY